MIDDAGDELAAVEALAVEMARLAGREITQALGRTLTVRYKELSPESQAAFRDPVSDVDRSVEAALREAVSARFPDHGIIGEEMDEQPGGPSGFVWVVDPVDGTANFVNGFPLFSASIGVLRHGEPVAGAIWCSTSHALRAGTYHARDGHPLRFENETIAAVDRTEVRRRIVAVPRAGAGPSLGYEARQTGSAAIECAFVAAGLLSGARFEAPNAWDVAAGVVLLKAAGASVVTRGGSDKSAAWEPFERFFPADRKSGGRLWRQSLIVGEPGAVQALASSD